MRTHERPVVLVVDDSPESRANLYQALDRAGYPTATLAHGRAALQFVAERKPGLVLLSVPEGDAAGARTLGRIKSIAPEAPVLLLQRRANPPHYRILCEPGAAMEGPARWMDLPSILDRVRRALARAACELCTV
ncbi:MAG TPA: response regulator [Planctomycetota bacterium]|nr:response regulator [Planctomycetota bacterium]